MTLADIQSWAGELTRGGANSGAGIGSDGGRSGSATMSGGGGGIPIGGGMSEEEA